MWNFSLTQAVLLVTAVIALCGVLWWLKDASPLIAVPRERDGSSNVGGVKGRAGGIGPLGEQVKSPVVGSESMVQGPQSQPSDKLSRLSVLLVEDHRDSRQMLAKTLEYYGASVVAVSSAIEALQMLERHPADVLLADLRLPGREGFALIHKLRARADPALASIPAASITASHRLEDRDDAFAAGYQIHIEEPVDPNELVSAVLTLATVARGATSKRHWS